MKPSDIKLQCRHWVEHFIIHWGVCPFAKAVFDSNDIMYRVIDSGDMEEQAVAIMSQIQQMKSDPSPETVLIIFPKGLEDFSDYLLLLEVCNQLIEQRGESDFIQLASFHPDYLFEGEGADSASHYSNRSPWPIIHLIRQNSIADALKNFDNPEAIPQRNIELMQQLGSDKLKQQLQDIRDLTSKPM